MNIRGLEYRVEDDGGRPVSVVLLHGFTGSIRSWDGVVDALRKFARVIRIDLPGHGRTAHTDDLDRFQLPAVAADVAEIVRQLGVGPVRLIGYSMGARLALQVALEHPEVVRSLLLESGSPGLATEAERAARRASDDALAARIERDGIGAFVRDWEALPMWQSQKHLSDAARAEQRARRLANHPAGLALSLRGMGTGAQPSLWEALPGLTLPVHCLVGALDTKFVQIAQAMRARIAAIGIDTVPDVGHAVHLEAPEAWLAWVRRCG